MVETQNLNKYMATRLGMKMEVMLLFIILQIKKTTYTFTLDRAFGLMPIESNYTISSPLSNASEFDGKLVSYGYKIEINLEPGEVKILDFKK